MTLSRDQILAVEDRLVREVDVPEWGGAVLVKALSGEERDAFEASLTVRRPAIYGPNKGQMETLPDNSNIHAKLVARSIVDADGARVFSDADIIEVGKKSSGALQRVWDVAAELSGLSDTASADAEGNSGDGPSDGSTSSEPTEPESP